MEWNKVGETWKPGAVLPHFSSWWKRVTKKWKARSYQKSSERLGKLFEKKNSQKHIFSKISVFFRIFPYFSVFFQNHFSKQPRWANVRRKLGLALQFIYNENQDRFHLFQHFISIFPCIFVIIFSVCVFILQIAQKSHILDKFCFCVHTLRTSNADITRKYLLW